MTRDEVIRVLTIRHSLCDQRFNAEAVNHWHDVLNTVDYGEAHIAMHRACREHSTVNLHQFSEHLAAHQRGKADPRDAHRSIDCPDCAGTGWRTYTRPNRHNASVEPCDHPGSITSNLIEYERGRWFMGRGIRDEMLRRGQDDEHIDTIIRRNCQLTLGDIDSRYTRNVIDTAPL